MYRWLARIDFVSPDVWMLPQLFLSLVGMPNEHKIRWKIYARMKENWMSLREMNGWKKHSYGNPEVRHHNHNPEHVK